MTEWRCPQCDRREHELSKADQRKWRLDGKALCPICRRKWNKPPVSTTTMPKCPVCGKRSRNHGDRCKRCIAAGYEAPTLLQEQ